MHSVSGHKPQSNYAMKQGSLPFGKLRVRDKLQKLSLLAGFFKLVTWLPGHQAWEISHAPANGKAEFRHLGVGGKVHLRTVLIRRLVITVGYIIAVLFLSPGEVMALEEHSFIHAEGWDTHPRQTEVIRTIVMAGFREVVRLDAEIKIVGYFLDQRVDRRPLRAGNHYLLRFAKGLHIVIVEIQ